MANIDKFPTAGGRTVPVDIVQMQDEIDELLNEVQALGHTLYALGSKGGEFDEFEPAQQLMLEQWGLRVEKNIPAAKSLIKKIADVAKGGSS